MLNLARLKAWRGAAAAGGLAEREIKVTGNTSRILENVFDHCCVNLIKNLPLTAWPFQSPRRMSGGQLSSYRFSIFAAKQRIE